MKERQTSAQKRRTSRYTAMIAVSVAATAHLASAQVQPAAGADDPAGQMRFYVELKDATLADAMEMVFKSSLFDA